MRKPIVIKKAKRIEVTDKDLFVQSLQEQRWYEQHNEEGDVDLWRSALSKTL